MVIILITPLPLPQRRLNSRPWSINFVLLVVTCDIMLSVTAVMRYDGYLKLKSIVALTEAGHIWSPSQVYELPRL